MSEPFLAEIKLVGFNFAPQGWALCNGQLLPINQNQALFSLLGTTYGGNGQTTFALPDLRGRTPIHVGSGVSLGERAGTESHTLSVQELPGHTHAVRASQDAADSPIPQDNLLAAANGLYGPADALVPLRTGTVAATGGSQAHPNMQPYLALHFCIALQGIFPSRN
jgi:microcystin-dependent protein